ENAWDKALREYQRALEEFPDDADARTNYAQALFRLQQWPAALDAYNALLRLRPSDPFVLGRVAECQISLKQPADAERTYMQVAQVYAAQNQVREALAALRSVLSLNPANRIAHERLAEFYKSMGERTLAIQEYLVLSRLVLEPAPGDLDSAVRYAELAFALDNSNPEARDWLYKLRRRQAEATGTTFDEKTLRVTGGSGQPQGRDLEQMFTLAMQYQEKGQYAAARVQFEAAQQAGLDTPGLHYNLALLYQQEKEWARATEQLQKAAGDPEYAMSSQYALGECYRVLGRPLESTRAFETAVSLVDLQHVSKNEIGDLIELYQAAADANIAQGDLSRAASLFDHIAQFLQARRWRTGYTEQLLARATQLNDQGISDRLLSIGGTPPPAAIQPEPAPPAPRELGAPLPQAAVSGGASPMRSGMLRPITDFLREQKAAQAPAAAAPLPAVLESPPVAAPESPPLPELRARVQAPARPPTGPLRLNGSTTPSTLGAVLVDEGLPLDSEAGALIEAIDTLIAQGLWMAATDCCYEVIRFDVDYLPVHLRLAQIYKNSGRLDDAIAKLQSVIDVYMVRGQLGVAVRVFPELIALQPENVNIRTKLATLLLDLGQQDAAVAEYLNLAEMYYGTGQRERALEELRRLRSLAPQNTEVRLRNGLYLLRADRAADALPEFSRALQLDPENKLALVRIFVSMAQLGHESEWDALHSLLAAAADYGARPAILDDLRQFALTSDRPELFYALALLNDLDVPQDGLGEDARPDVEKRHLRAQIDALDKGLALLAPKDPNPLGQLMRYRRAHLALVGDDSRRAVTLLTDSLTAMDEGRVGPSPRPNLPFLKLPTRLDIYQPLAQAYALQGENVKAIACLQAAKAHAPYDRGIYTQLAELYFLQGQLGAALVALDELITHYQDTGQIEKVLETLGYMAKLAPNNITVRQKLADTYLKIGYIDLGLAELEVLAELQRKAGMVKDAVKTYQRGADIYWQMGHLQEAFTIYDRVVHMAPGDVDARQQLIHLYITTGRLADATREQKRIAEIYLQQKRSKDAIAALHELIALAPNDTESYYALAEVLAEQNEFGQAARLYGRLRRLEPAKDQQLAALQAEMQRLAQEHAGGSRTGPAGGR
ncbi:MAG TPA: tetratricopeptide repeat protein, partial [Chloroflexia bacterium]|nr:tetratricopeptide repeat protein [Chloroflexia bacterium]